MMDRTDFNAAGKPVREVFGTGTNPPPTPLTEEQKAAIAASNVEYKKRRTTLTAQAAVAIDPNADPEAKQKAVEVLKFYKTALAEFVEQNPTVHPDSGEADFSARLGVWLELDVLLEEVKG
jgi:hypothetical protein